MGVANSTRSVAVTTALLPTSLSLASLSGAGAVATVVSTARVTSSALAEAEAVEAVEGVVGALFFCFFLSPERAGDGSGAGIGRRTEGEEAEAEGEAGAGANNSFTSIGVVSTAEGCSGAVRR